VAVLVGEGTVVLVRKGTVVVAGGTVVVAGTVVTAEVVEVDVSAGAVGAGPPAEPGPGVPHALSSSPTRRAPAAQPRERRTTGYFTER
jgi:hypothetical protein